MRSAGTPAWTLIIVPPNAGASTRRVGLKIRWVRMLGMVVLTGAVLSWLWAEAQSRITESITEQLVAEQQATLALRDTLQSMRDASAAERIRNSPPADMLMPVNAEITSPFSRSRFHPLFWFYQRIPSHHRRRNWEISLYCV